MLTGNNKCLVISGFKTKMKCVVIVGKKTPSRSLCIVFFNELQPEELVGEDLHLKKKKVPSCSQISFFSLSSI